MKLLIEKLIVDKDVADNLDRTDPEMIMRIVNDTSIFPNSNGELNSFKEVIVDSIKNYGLDTANNKFLNFVVSPNIEKLGKGDLSKAYAQVVQKAFQENSIKLAPGSFASQWLWDKRAYDGHVSKLNALIILSDPEEADKYADPKTRKDLLPKLLAVRTQKDIADVLDNWQTRDGTDSRNVGFRGGKHSGAGKGEKVESEEVTKKKLYNIVKGLNNTYDDSMVNKAIDKIYQKSRTISQLLPSLIGEIVNVLRVDVNKDLEKAEAETTS